MTLSDAMYKGAALHPQGFGDCITNWFDPTGPCTCAIGAAYEGATGLLPFDDYYEAVAFEAEDGEQHDDQDNDPRLIALIAALEAAPAFPVRLADIETAVAVVCAVDPQNTLVLPDGSRQPIFEALAILNDQLTWPREQIAEYIAAQGF